MADSVSRKEVVARSICHNFTNCLDRRAEQWTICLRDGHILVQRKFQLHITLKAEGEVGWLTFFRAILTYDSQTACATKLNEEIVCFDSVAATDTVQGYVVHQSGQKCFKLLEFWLIADALTAIGDDRVDQLGQ